MGMAARRMRSHIIIRYAKDHEVDLIVLGTHGQSTVDSMLLGSVARKVVGKASCPVLTVRHPEYQYEMPLRQISSAIQHTKSIQINEVQEW